MKSESFMKSEILNNLTVTKTVEISFKPEAKKQRSEGLVLTKSVTVEYIPPKDE